MEGLQLWSDLTCTFECVVLLQGEITARSWRSTWLFPHTVILNRPQHHTTTRFASITSWRCLLPPASCSIVPCRCADRFKMYQGRLRSKRTRPTAAVTSLCDILHQPETMEPILKALSAPDLLRFASTSQACRAAASLSHVQLDINSEAGLKAFKGLHRLGCLQQLRKADLTAVVSDAEAIGHLTLLGSCSQLKALWLVFDFNPDKLWWWDPYITIWANRAYGDAYMQAKGVSLSELASHMPTGVMRTITSYANSQDWDPYDCCCGFSENPRLESSRGSRQVCKSSSTLERCTCYDARFTFEAGKPAISNNFYDY